MSADEPRFYWEGWHEGNGTDPKPFGIGTARIIDLEAGGVIAYCHSSMAHVIVMALRTAEAISGTLNTTLTSEEVAKSLGIDE